MASHATPMTTDEFIRRFTYDRGPLIEPWRDLRKSLRGVEADHLG